MSFKHDDWILSHYTDSVLGEATYINYLFEKNNALYFRQMKNLSGDENGNGLEDRFSIIEKDRRATHTKLTDEEVATYKLENL